LLPQVEDLGFASSLRAAQPRQQHCKKSQDRDHSGQSLSDWKAVDRMDEIFGRDRFALTFGMNPSRIKAA
jgi:hypothetical protein